MDSHLGRVPRPFGTASVPVLAIPINAERSMCAAACTAGETVACPSRSAPTQHSFQRQDRQRLVF